MLTSLEITIHCLSKNVLLLLRVATVMEGMIQFETLNSLDLIVPNISGEVHLKEGILAV